jgi:hypothetical protein
MKLKLGTILTMAECGTPTPTCKNPSTLQQRREAAQRQTPSEVADDEEGGSR